MSAIAAISAGGLLGVDLTTGAVNGEIFLDFIRATLIPETESFEGPKKNYWTIVTVLAKTTLIRCL